MTDTPEPSARDREYMDQALALAARAAGRTSPNPMVGCVLVRDGQVVGQGFHRRAGTPHAEALALAEAGDRARGATAYVTLEPCAHHGRTPPCADALVRAGVARVVAAMVDPNPLVAGQGLARLRAAGIDVTVGLRETEARRLNEAWLTFIQRGRPFVWLKAAMTLDGKIATASGDARWISGEAARLRGHELRDRLDAIMVGVGTVLRDDPQLTCRIEGGRDPVRVIVDSKLRTPPSTRAIRARHDGSPAPTWVVCSAAALEREPALADRARALADAGAEVVPVPAGPDGRVDPGALLAELHRREIVSVLLEGGAELNASFLVGRCVDKAWLFVAPKFALGRGAPTVAGGEGAAARADAWPWRIERLEGCGQDALLECYPIPRGEGQEPTPRTSREIRKSGNPKI